MKRPSSVETEVEQCICSLQLVHQVTDRDATAHLPRFATSIILLASLLSNATTVQCDNQKCSLALGLELKLSCKIIVDIQQWEGDGGGCRYEKN